MAGRRAQSNSVGAQVDAFRRAGQTLSWPDAIRQLPHQDDADRAGAIFAALAQSRDIADWRPGDILLLAQLANANAQADRLTHEIEVTGWTIPSPKNPDQQIRNPALDAMSMVSSRQLALTRALALNGAPGDRRTAANHQRTAAAARAIVEDDDGHSLLAQ
jgi:hypothetical protein